MQKFNGILHCDLLNWFHIDVAEMTCRCCVAGGGYNVSPCRNRIAVVSQRSKFFCLSIVTTLCDSATQHDDFIVTTFCDSDISAKQDRCCKIIPQPLHNFFLNSAPTGNIWWCILTCIAQLSAVVEVQCECISIDTYKVVRHAKQYNKIYAM